MSHMSHQPSISNQGDEEEEDRYIDSVVPLGKISSTKSVKQKENGIKRLKSQVEEAEELMNSSWWSQLKYFSYIYLFSPLKSLLFFRYPPVTISIAYSAPCYAVLYILNMTLSYKYARSPYNFSSILIGLVYIPNSVTYFIASIFGGRFNDHLLKKKKAKYGIVAPEARFGINIYIAAMLLPGSLFITGWCLHYGEHWVTPLIGTAIFGFAQMIVIGVTITYLADSLPGRGATGIALSNFVRQILATGCSFAAVPLNKAMGTGPLFSMCAGVLVVLASLIYVLKMNGDRWRETYDLEHLYDLVDS
ncbi:unnamed protein product [Ambrosiozyma monospora]|uniref:Unnamed protein product n=1 Tax=Ambrosiozyma monospora TaxID=43982 RepID=A0ACB5U2L8_AMBMO|nr:unnamed protein product [Ambrosiozyma monospora]